MMQRKQEIEDQEILKKEAKLQELRNLRNSHEHEKEHARENMEFNDQFHDGYLLAKHEPALLDAIMHELDPDDHEKREGYIWGQWFYQNEDREAKEQRQSEKISVPMNQWALDELSKLREKGTEIDRDLEFDE